MIKVDRLPLSAADVAELAQYQLALTDCQPKSPLIKQRWSVFTQDPLRERIVEYLDEQSRDKCVYCENLVAGTIDHFWPKGLYPERTFVWENLNRACWQCNRSKGKSLLLRDGSPVLLNPMDEQAANYFHIDTDDGKMSPAYGLTPLEKKRAQHTIERLKLNERPLLLLRSQSAQKLIVALYLYYERGTPTAEESLLEALNPALPARAVARQIMRSKAPTLRPIIDNCLARSARVQQYVTTLGWV